MEKLPESYIKHISNTPTIAGYLRQLQRGRDFTPRSNLYKQTWDANEVISVWSRQLFPILSKIPFGRRILEVEQAQLKKVGPQGGVPPVSQCQDILQRGFGLRKTPEAFSSREWQEAKNIAREHLLALGAANLRPMEPQHVVQSMQMRNTLISKSGWPDHNRRNDPLTLNKAIIAAQSGEWKTYPAIALFREYWEKLRLVWMFPLAVNIHEGMYYLPQFSKLSSTGDRFFAPWKGFDACRELITEIYADRKAYVVASDFSKTDEHFSLVHSMEVCDVLEHCFQNKHRVGLRESLQYMHTIPLISGPSSWEIGEHGLSSGSNWTNYIETIFDMIFCEYVRIVAGAAGVPVEGLYAIGDDIAWVVHSSNTIEEVSSIISRCAHQCGMECNEEKVTNDYAWVKSLQRVFQRGYFRQSSRLVRAVYPSIRALGTSVWPERFHRPENWSKDMDAIRQIMILENTVDHPLFERFVKFISRGLPYIREFAKNSKVQLDNTMEKAQSIPGFNPTYNQEKEDTSLSQFASVELLRKL